MILRFHALPTRHPMRRPGAPQSQPSFFAKDVMPAFMLTVRKFQPSASARRASAMSAPSTSRPP